MKLVVLVSGNGSNLQAILDAIKDGRLTSAVELVISNRQDAFALERARQNRIPFLAFPSHASLPRETYDAILARAALAFEPDYILLLGWMKILTSIFIDNFPGRIINLHPALPGTFPGTHAIERAWAAYQAGTIHASGVMVHYVLDEGVDSGLVISKKEILMTGIKTFEEFERITHETEHELVVATLQELEKTGTSFKVRRYEHEKRADFGV